MTTTLIQSKNPQAKMHSITGMESLNFKMVSILFIVILNITKLNSQTIAGNFGYKNQNSIYASSFPVKEKEQSHFVNPTRVYTLFMARTFPKLENAAKNNLNKKEDTEAFDYDVLFCQVVKTEIKISAKKILNPLHTSN
jgi:hypothetical protein